MKLLRSVALVVAVAFMIASFAGISFAKEKMCHKDFQAMCQAKIKALKDSAAILQKTDPALAKGLNELAAEKEKKLQDMMDMKAKHEAKEKLLRDSAASLQKTNPELAKELWDMSEYHRHMGKMGMGKCPMCGKSSMGMKGHGEAGEEEAGE